MKAQVVIMQNGAFALMIQEGTYEEGEAQIKKALADLASQGIVIEKVSKVEAHRHGDQAVNLTVNPKLQNR